MPYFPKYLVWLVLVSACIITLGTIGLSMANASKGTNPDAEWRWYWRQPPYHIVYGGTGYPYLFPSPGIIMLDHENPRHFYTISYNTGLLNGSYLYPDGLWTSVDSGNTWSYLDHIDDYPENSVEGATTLFTHPLTPTLLFAGYERSYYTAGIYRSEDSGGSWQSVLPYLGVTAIAVAPSEPQRMYAATLASAAPPERLGGVYMSTDAGINWERVSETSIWLHDIQVHPTNPNLLYGVSWFSTNPGEGLFKSEDAGRTWMFVTNFDGQGQRHLLIDPENPNRMYAYGRTYSGMYQSSDGGQTWIHITENLPPNPITGAQHTILKAVLDPSDPKTIWMGVMYMGIFVSRDGGDTWQDASDGLFFFGGGINGPQCNSIALSPDGHHGAICGGFLYVREPNHGTPTPVPTFTPIPTRTSTPTLTPTPLPTRIFIPFLIRGTQP